MSEDVGDDCMTITVRYTRNGKLLKATIQADKWRGMSTAMDSGETIEWGLVPVWSARDFSGEPVHSPIMDNPEPLWSLCNLHGSYHGYSCPVCRL